MSKNNTLENLINKLSFIDSKDYYLPGRIPKISFQIEREILKKLFSENNIFLKNLMTERGNAIYYRTSGGRYFNVITNYSTGSTKEKAIYFDKKLTNSIGACLSSSLFWWYQQVYTNTLDLKMYELEDFTIPILSFTDKTIKELGALYTDYLTDIEKNVIKKVSSEQSSYNISEFKEYKIRKSKHLIDQIDDLICPLYGLMTEETNFIKNYEIEFRLSDSD